MKKELIINYINDLTDEDINKFLNKNNIVLNSEEYIFLKTIIKEKYNDIFEENTYLFKLIKNTINEGAYKKLLDLYIKYKVLIKN